MCFSLDTFCKCEGTCNGYTMHENGNNFHKLLITTAGNRSVENCYQKLKVNFNYCFRHGIFQNQVYNFFCIISWVVSHSSFIFFSSRFFNSKICLFFFSEFLVIWMFVKNSIFTLQILEKQLHALAWHTLHKSWQTLSYMWKFTREKDIGKRKVHSPVK